MAQNYSIKLTGDTSELQKSLKDTKESFEKITNSGKSLGAKIADIKKEMLKMSEEGTNVGKEGEAMWQQLAQAAKDYKDQIDDVNNAMKTGGKGFDFKSMGKDVADNFGMGGAFEALTGAINPATIAVGAVATTMVAAGKKAADFEVHLDSLQALTGVTDDVMSQLSDTTLDMSKKFGMSASDIVDSMGLIGSQAPELLKNTDALASVTDASMTLAKAGSITAEAAGKAITTVTNQMGVSASEAMNIANTLEAAEQQGAASVEYLNKAIEKSGTQAKSAGMSYVELAAMIESVAPKFSSADVAGSQLNSTLLKLSMGADEFNPAVVGMSQALQNLSDAQLTNEQLSKMVGEANITMIKTMIDGKDSFEDFSVSLNGTNSAVDAWKMKSDNMTGAIDKLKATWDAFLIKLGQSGILKGIADNIMYIMEAIGEVIDVIDEVISSFGLFDLEVSDMSASARWQLDLVVEVIRGIGTVIQIVVAIVAKAFNAIKNAAGAAGDWIGEKWEALKKTLGDTAFGRFVINAFNSIMKAVGKVIEKIKKWWNEMCDFLGLESKKIGTKIEAPELETTPAQSNDNNSNSTTTTKTGGGSKSAKSGKVKSVKVEKVKVEAEEGSIKALQDRVSALNKELNETNVSEDRLKVINDEKSALEEQIKALQKRNGLLKETPVKEEKAVDPLDEKRKQYNDANSKINQVKADFAVGLIDKSQAEAAIAQANAVIQSIGLEPLELHVNDDGTITSKLEELQKFKEQMSEVAGAVGNVGNVFGSLGSAIGGTTGEVMNFAGQSINAIAQVLPQIITLITAKNAEAIAAGTSSAAALPFPASIAAIASIVATIAGVFASLPSFEQGGIVPGSSFRGDKVLSRLNSGEGVLTRKGIDNLHNMMSSGEVGPMSNTLRGEVDFKISGSVIKGALKNYDTKMSKIK